MTSLTAPEPGRQPVREPGRVRLDTLKREPCIRWRIDDAHAAVLAQVLEDCPPITITGHGRIVDGLHRVEAARRRGWVSDTRAWRKASLESGSVTNNDGPR